MIDSAKIFYGLDKPQVKRLAYNYAVAKKKSPIPDSWKRNQMAGEDWLRGFRRRVGGLSIRKTESTSLARAMSFNPSNVSKFFENVKKLYDRFAVHPLNVWNLDETGVNTVPNSRQILCETGARQVGQIRSGERGVNVTVCCCINAIGNYIPPAFIFPRVNFKAEMVRGAPPGSLGLANPSGWMKSDCFPKVLRHFISCMSVSKENPGLLIMDNHCSHISLEVIDLARDHGLSLLTLPPHCSHKLQPLDVGVFGPFKKFFSKVCDEWHATHPGQSLTIYYIAELFTKAMVKSFTPENIIASFRRTGIYPLNSDIFTEAEFLPSTVTEQPHSPSPSSTNWSPGRSDLSHTAMGTVESPAESEASTSCILATPPQCEATVLHSLRSLPKAKSKPRSNRKKLNSAVITDTPEKQKLFPCRQPTSSDEDLGSDAENVVYMDSDTDPSETFSDTDLSSSSCEKSPLNLEVGDYVIAKVHILGKNDQSKKFIGKISKGPDHDGDFEITYLERSKKIKNGFIFPDEQDMASIARKDILKKLSKPQPVAQTKRLSGVLRFSEDISSV